MAGISFTVAGGEALLLTGRNGAGKTTLLKVLSGAIEPAEGRVRLSGADGDGPIAEQAHVVGHLDGVRRGLTVAENVLFWAGYLGGEAVHAEAALERSGLGPLADFPAAYLSAGQKRRLALARLLAAPRPLWLLDEPAAALDTPATEALALLIDEHTAAGGMAVIATHGPLHIARAKVLRLDGATTSA